MRGKSPFLMLSLLFFARLLCAQEVTGILEGRILDSAGKPIAAVMISISGPSLQGIREVHTDERGYFHVFSLRPGSYSVKFQHPVFREVAFENISIGLGKTTSLGDIRLQQKVQVAHEITVTAEKPLIDLTSTAVGNNLVFATIEPLPVERNYRYLMAFLPEANQSYYGDEANVAGASGLENRYFVDGMDVTDPYRSFGGINLPYNFIKEIEIKTGGYEAEYRSSLGGLLNAVTYSGGNEFHGQVFGFYTDHSFSQTALRSELEPGKGNFSQYDFGLSLGGPIIRDKIWFFGAFDPSTVREDILIPGLGYYPDKLTQNIFAGKITWQVSPKANFVLTAIGDPSMHRLVSLPPWSPPVSAALNPDPFLGERTEGGISLLASGNYMFSDAFFLEASISHISRRFKDGPATERGKNDLFFLDQVNNIIFGGYGSQSDEESVQTTLSGKGTLLLGNHILKAGIEYRDNRLDESQDQLYLLASGPNDVIGNFKHSQGTVRNRIPSLFVQDSWKVSTRLQVNVGLRWEGEFFIASDRRCNQKITDEYQPRIGFIFQPDKGGSNKIFGSFGRFYQSVSTYLLAWYQLEGNIWKWLWYDHDPRVDPSGAVVIAETSGEIQPEVKGLQGQHYYEFVLGYEQALGKSYKFEIRGIYRRLREGIEDGIDPVSGGGFGNPGKPPLQSLPRMIRNYSGLELTAEKSGGNFNFMASYVLSRSYGNYTGLFFQDLPAAMPNASGQFDSPEEMDNLTGLLPNDRTHVFKLFGSYRFAFGLSVGAFFLWQSGTPLSELGASTMIPGWIIYLRQRGTAGRTPSLADFNLRIVYDLARITRTKFGMRLMLDAFHIGSGREPVMFDQWHYFRVDENGNQIDPNPYYGHATAYFPPMSARLGLEIGF